jgi:hypothetical protein
VRIIRAIDPDVNGAELQITGGNGYNTTNVIQTTGKICPFRT